jgi:hypothetical protein
VNAADIRRWAAGHRAAAERERAESRGKPWTASEAFKAALALLVFDQQMNGWPFNRSDPVSDREDQEARAAWAKLRARWRSGC